MIKLLRDLYLPNRFFYLIGISVALFGCSFFIPYLFPVAKVMMVVSVALILTDSIILFNPRLKVLANRRLPKVFSLGDENNVYLTIVNQYVMPLRLVVIDELPYQLQKRDFKMSLLLTPGKKKELEYSIKPLERGEYWFYKVNVYATSLLGLVERRFVFDQDVMIRVYPSLQQMKKYELLALARISNYEGIKQIRKLGHSYEFEQIKNYVEGDDYRSINWKATSRRNVLMVNQYEDERAQQVYCIIDKSRSMKLPFEGLSLLDYAINTSLVISNIALQKHDKAGLLTFAERIDKVLKADRKRSQLKLILDALYNQSEGKMEANFELLYLGIKNGIRGRSLIFLFSNFESLYSLERSLSILRKINKQHLLVMIFFENTEIVDYTKKHCDNLEEIYFQTIAQKFVSEKYQMVNTLQQFGIQTILTRPEDLSINTVNKYLELKARGLI